MEKRRVFEYKVGNEILKKIKLALRENIIHCPSLERLVSEKVEKDDTVLISASVTRPRIIEQKLKRKCSFIVFSDENLKIPVLFKYGHGVYIPNNACAEIVEKALIMAREISNNIGTLVEEFVGVSESIKRTRAQIQKAIESGLANFHIEGESGTGKTWIAKILHLHKNPDKTFVSRSCSLLSGTLFKSDLFGHKKGSFTGSEYERKGLFTIVNGGDLFLDEIQDLPLKAQARLLQVFDSGEYIPLGEDRPVKTSFSSLITAANIPIDILLKNEKLRLDFWHRLSPYVIRTEPLRDHREDIKYLVSHYEEANDIPAEKALKDTSALEKRSWKGNVRELYSALKMYHNNLMDLEGNLVL